ncbi:deoxyribodipyrimidine photolyase [Rudanella paleaurantiibacter]|uniref:Deoxyribodipyrimidine photolyase n=1 Tax=Rudanella paleaurantiibacter TaxID=2614655 RepID=A0A7J5TSP9_9BACT|nr:deoxyribodipyrimidine photo-lyase [Rudanella paleaurantiibacter]KAB7726446.1 deoxyribodipyrimidine photolyase [Rudanella paleaurantiibacter]
MNKPSGINVLWFKRDLRLRDHEPLKAAIEAGQQSGRPLLLLYCFEPSVMADPNYAMRHWRFVYESLTDLNGQLMDLPITYTAPVYLFQREVIDVLTALHRQFTIHTLYSHQETGLRITYDRDKIVARFCQQHRLDWREYESNAVRRGLKTGVGVQANWDRTMQQCQQQPDLTRWQPVRLLANWYEVERGPALPDDWQQTDPQFQPGGERNAHRYMTSFFAQRIAQYENSISKPLESRRGGSRLSPYLAWGCLSARQVYQAYQQAVRPPNGSNGIRPSALFISRLRAQSYFIQLFERDERIEFENKHSAFDALEKQVNPAHFLAWQTGQTGYPLIDACMRCLIATGYVNFRMRALLISFLTHHLFQHWQEGGWHLARQYTDFEPGIHYAQLQLQAGILASDRQPVRIYNPVKQSQEHDPEGQFIRQWVPELVACPTRYIHQPWTMPALEQQTAGCRIGQEYPAPIIDTKQTYQFAQEQFYKFRNQITSSRSDLPGDHLVER